MELFFTPMPVIALAGFIVITEHALLVNDVGQMVLEGMRQAPQNQLRELVLGKDDPLTEQLCVFDVGENDNRNAWVSNVHP